MDRPAAGRVLDAHRAVAVEQDPGDEGPGLDGQVLPAHDRVEVGACRTQPATAVDGPVEGPEPLLAIAVDVRGVGVAGLLGGLEERAEQRVRGRTTLQDQRAVMATERIVGRRGQAGLHPLEVRQAVGVVPGRHAGIGGPALVVERIAALEDLAVDAGRPAQHLAPGVVDPPTVHERLRLRLVLPVVEPAADRERQRRGHVDEDVEAVIGTTGLQHEDPVRRGGRQAIAEGAAGGSAAHDDEVVPALGHGFDATSATAPERA